MDAAKKLENTESTSDQKEWAVRLFNKSPLKQQKWKFIKAYLGETSEKECLDIGSDNGVISLFAREHGGTWSSVDLIPETVESIQSLVGERVFQIDGKTTPFNEGQFDLVVIVDILEHIETDKEFIEELYRVMKPGGELIVNVPNPTEGLLRKIKHAIGQTDEAHGHLRPGYTLEEVKELLGDKFEIQEHTSYRRLFSDLVDTLITGALDFLKGNRGQKGTVVTGDDMAKLKKSFKLYSLIYPFIWFAVKLDEWLPITHGNMLIAKAVKTPSH